MEAAVPSKLLASEVSSAALLLFSCSVLTPRASSLLPNSPMLWPLLSNAPSMAGSLSSARALRVSP